MFHDHSLLGLESPFATEFQAFAYGTHIEVLGATRNGLPHPFFNELPAPGLEKKPAITLDESILPSAGWAF
jgi:hypothetical protein